MLKVGIDNMLELKSKENVLIMHYFEKKPMKQIAKELGVCPSTGSSHNSVSKETIINPKCVLVNNLKVI